MPVTLYHETAPSIALAIAKSKRCFAGPILADSGLNVEIVGHPKGPFLQDQAEWQGARMVFEWGGPIVVAEKAHGYPPDILYDHHPHRGLVPVGTSKFLTLVNVQLIRGASWEMAVAEPRFSAFGRWCASWLPRWRQRQAKRIAQEVAEIVRSCPPIRVIFPPNNAYEGILRERFPQVDWSA